MKKTFILFLFVAMACGQSGCTRENTDNGIWSEGLDSLDISALGEVVALEKDSLTAPDLLLAIGEYVVLSNSTAEDVLTVYNRSNATIQRLQRMGNGPQELLNVNQLGVYPDQANLSFYIHDDLRNNLFVYVIADGVCKLSEVKPLAGFNMVALGDEISFGTPAQGPSRFVTYGAGGDTLKFGDYAEYHKVEDTFDNTLSAGFAVINEVQNTFAWFSFYGESINFFNYKDNNSITELKKAQYVKPIFDEKLFDTQGSVVFDTKNPLGFLAVTSSNTSIYALFNGNTLMDFLTQQEKALLCNHIAVLDWKGNYAKRLYSSQPIRSISYNRADDKLYLLRVADDLNYEVVSLDVSQL